MCFSLLVQEDYFPPVTVNRFFFSRHHFIWKTIKYDRTDSLKLNGKLLYAIELHETASHGTGTNYLSGCKIKQ